MECLVVLGGTPICLNEFVNTTEKIICADSGADHVISQGFMPDVLLGDMDSISNLTLDKCSNNNVIIKKYPKEKDMTDGQLAILYAKENNFDSVNIICAEGSFDHYLGNIYLLIYANNIGIKAKLTTTDSIVYAVKDNIKITGLIGDRVSIIPADSDIIIEETKGLYYEVKTPLKVKFGHTIGLGNHMVETYANIKIVKGTAFVSKQRKVKNT